MSEPRGLHNHPVTGPVIVLHSRDAVVMDEEHPGHAFGPFGTEDEARAFEEKSTDECHKVILDLIPVGDQVTVSLPQLTGAIHLVRHEHGQYWAPQPGCGCAETAGMLWQILTNTVQLPDEPATDERIN
jgi:hypothetical protein